MMKITNLEQLRQAAAVVQPYVNEMCNAKDTDTIVKCMEIVKEAVSAIYVYKVETVATKNNK